MRYKAIAGVLQVPMHLSQAITTSATNRSIDAGRHRLHDYIAMYQHVRPDYFSFDQGPIRCVVINALLINSGLSGEQEQRDWLGSTAANAVALLSATTRRTLLTTSTAIRQHRSPGHAWLQTRSPAPY
jgi:hypothetical protein